MLRNMAHILITSQRLIDITRRELVQFLVMTKDDNSNIDRTQDGQLVRLLEKTSLSLEKGSICKVSRARPIRDATRSAHSRTLIYSGRP